MLIRTFTIAAALCAAGLSAQAPCEISVNGDFETGDLTGWQEFPSAAGQISIVAGNNSSSACNINNSNAPSAALIKNANIGVGIVQPNEAITISVSAKGATAVGGVVFVELFSEVAGGGVSRSEILGGAPLALNPDPNVWTDFTFNTVTGPDVSGGVTLQIASITGAATGSMSDVTVDDISVTVSRAAASWNNYGTGFGGSNGRVPGISMDANPVQGTTPNIVIGNVSGSTAIGGLLLGAQTSSPTPFGGTLLVNSFFTETFPMLAPGATNYALPIPTDSALCGVTVYGQAIHSDAGAAQGIAFTQGLAINIGG